MGTLNPAICATDWGLGLGELMMRRISVISASIVTWWALGCGPAETADAVAGGTGGATTTSTSSGGGGAGGAGGAGGGGGGGDITRQWAEEVALGTEFGGDGQVIVRWTHPVRISVMSGSATSDLQDAVSLLSSLLGPSGITVEQAADQDATADVEVYLTTLDSFGGIAEDNGFEYVPGNLGYFYMFWDTDHSLSKAYVLLASDKLAGEKMRHFTFEELTQSFGFGNDSAVYSESIFYAKGFDGGDAQTLSTLDRKLVKFVYEHLDPGSNEDDFDAAYDAYWDSE